MSSITTSAPSRARDTLGDIRATLSRALIITRREVRDSLRDWRIMAPIFLLTLIFPLLANVMTRIFAASSRTTGPKTSSRCCCRCCP